MIPADARETEKQGSKESQGEHSSQQDGLSDMTNKWHDYMIIPGFCKSGIDIVIEAEASLHWEEWKNGGREEDSSRELLGKWLRREGEALSLI